MASFDRIKPGDVLYDVHRTQRGYVRGMSRLGCWPVTIVSIDPVTRSAQAKWNGNAPRRYCESELKRLRRSPVEETSR